MAAKKRVEAGHTVVTDEKAFEEQSATVLDGMVQDGPYQPGMAPLASKGSNAGAFHTQASLRSTNKAALEAIARKRGVDLSTAKNNGSRADLIWADIQAKGEREPLTDETVNEPESVSIADTSLDTPSETKVTTAKPTGTPRENTPDKKAFTGESSVVVLKKGGSFSSGGQTYAKDVPIPVSPEMAERLLKTKFFVKG